MNVIPLLVLCSFVLVAAAVLLFVFAARQGDCQQAERMCLMPLDDDEPAAISPTTDQPDDPRNRDAD